MGSRHKELDESGKEWTRVEFPLPDQFKGKKAKCCMETDYTPADKVRLDSDAVSGWFYDIGDYVVVRVETDDGDLWRNAFIMPYEHRVRRPNTNPFWLRIPEDLEEE